MDMSLLRNSAAGASLSRSELTPPGPNSAQSLGCTGRRGNEGERLPSCVTFRRGGVQFGGGSRIRRGGDERRRRVSSAAWLDPHSIAFLADLIDTSKLPVGPHSFAFLADVIDTSELSVRITLDPSRKIITERSNWNLSEQAIKNVFMAASLAFTWGCCVFGSMNDTFYDSDEYRKAGGNGTGHWIYDRQNREERAAREEMWSEDLIKEIEEKAEDVRKAEDEKEKEIELV